MLNLMTELDFETNRIYYIYQCPHCQNHSVKAFNNNKVNEWKINCKRCGRSRKVQIKGETISISGPYYGSEAADRLIAYKDQVNKIIEFATYKERK